MDAAHNTFMDIEKLSLDQIDEQDLKLTDLELDEISAAGDTRVAYVYPRPKGRVRVIYQLYHDNNTRTNLEIVEFDAGMLEAYTEAHHKGSRIFYV